MAVKINSLPPEHKAEALEALFATGRNFKGEDAVRNFIEYLLTESEQITIGRRLQIAALLQSGISQTEIRQRLGVSPSTFSRTRQWLEKEMPNYGDALKANHAARVHQEQAPTAKPEPGPSKDTGRFTVAKRPHSRGSFLFNLASKLRGK